MFATFMKAVEGLGNAWSILIAFIDRAEHFKVHNAFHHALIKKLFVL